jgi:hypothetical protein
MWSEVPSLHFRALLLSSITYKCLLKVLCLVRRPVTTLDSPIKGQQSGPCSHFRAPNQLSSLSVCTRTMPQYHRLVIHPVFYLSMFCLETPPERLRSNNPLNRTVPCELVGDFITSYSSMSRDPIQPHSVMSRDIIQCHLSTFIIYYIGINIFPIVYLLGLYNYNYFHKSTP